MVFITVNDAPLSTSILVLAAPPVPEKSENVTEPVPVAVYFTILVRLVHPEATFEFKTALPTGLELASTSKYTSLVLVGFTQALPNKRYSSPALTFRVIAVPGIIL